MFDSFWGPQKILLKVQLTSAGFIKLNIFRKDVDFISNKVQGTMFFSMGLKVFF